MPRLLEPHWSADRIGVTTLIALAVGSTVSLLVTRYTSRLRPVIMPATLVTTGGLAVALPLISTWPMTYATAFAVFAATAGMAWYAGQLGKATPKAHQSR